ncbi:hypothetical protein GMDG_05606 [Pseudogymnoascus destructans 20631-21]|uniref:NADH dehydrogenase [ubiquinone] 1 beta subcomplex subunit 11, mitochondrial n=1 Tax=Pseudogymnoascus destructans (strain ATCC MYA-4855 / 20631-21) TaxID=658429 RepID=L8FNU3_PSED2|nr:hypothetical protein GMDG_05606 [Pseudogymnoascus destructans 20631-21]
MQPLLRSAHRCTLKPLRTAGTGGKTTTRALSATTRARAAAEGESHYDPPTGWLWGVKPGEKIQTWALEEARRRLEVEGILKEPESKE